MLSSIAISARQLRRDAVALLYHAGSGHPGGALSAADIVAYLWEKELSYGSANRRKTDRNRLILSKGHSVAVVYAAAGRCGLIAPGLAKTLRGIGSPLQGHPHVLDTDWVETSTGSLGQGFSAAIGMALGCRYQEIANRIYVILGDGELQEGEVWEGVMCAGHFKLDSLCAIVDYNKMQSDDLNANIMGLEPLRDKWVAFNWHAIEIDGHDLAGIDRAVAEAKATKGKPTVIIAHTVKGKGVSYMEGIPAWHGSVKLRDTELVQALRDLETPEAEVASYLDGSFWEKR